MAEPTNDGEGQELLLAECGERERNWRLNFDGLRPSDVQEKPPRGLHDCLGVLGLFSALSPLITFLSLILFFLLLVKFGRVTSILFSGSMKSYVLCLIDIERLVSLFLFGTVSSFRDEISNPNKNFAVSVRCFFLREFLNLFTGLLLNKEIGTEKICTR